MSVKDMVMVAFFVAITAVCSQVVIPLPFTPIPVNLALLAVFTSGALMGPVKAAVAQAVYLLAGAVGVPVFAGFSGGVGVVFGPRGGYIIGYILTAALVGALCRRFGRGVFTLALCMLAGLLCCYAVGTGWFMMITKTPFTAAISMCILPFFVGDAFKIVAAALLVKRIGAFGTCHVSVNFS